MSDELHYVGMSLSHSDLSGTLYVVRDALKEAGISPHVHYPGSKTNPLMEYAIDHSIRQTASWKWCEKYKADRTTWEPFHFPQFEPHPQTFFYANADGEAYMNDTVCKYDMVFRDKDMALLFKLTWGGK